MDRMHSKFRRSRSPLRKDDRDSPRDRSRRRYDKSRSPSPFEKRYRNRSRSPGDRKGHGGNRANPTPSRVIGIFGLSVHTSEGKIRQIFSKFGPIDRLKLVYDTKTGRSRGFCFVYYENTEDARAAKDQCTGMELDRQRIRVDFSLTTRAHSPTPGVYMGKPTRGDHREERDRDYSYNRSSSGSRGGGSYRRRRSPSPEYRRRRRERSVSFSPRIR